MTLPSDAPPRVSVVIVSRGRPKALARCLVGVSQLQYDPFEVVVVADLAGVAVAGRDAHADSIKVVAFDEANISAARNLGVAHAAGEIVAFIDDDAVPEPLWLRHLVAPAAQGDVAAMGGYVRGRNGISFQYRAQRLNARGAARPIEVDPAEPTVLPGITGEAIKTEGTNMAFRRDVLVALGGFDPAFAYYLDETDLNMRLAAAGHATAIVPLAEVHHGYAANSMRTAERVPTDLFDIGASWAVFQRKHMAEDIYASHWANIYKGERDRLLRHLRNGTLEPRDVRHLLKRLRLGYVEGQYRPLAQGSVFSKAAQGFQRFPAQERESIVITARSWRVAAAKKQAKVACLGGKIPTVMAFSPSSLYHQVVFHEDGFWLHLGGQFGRSDRKAPVFKAFSLKQRVRHETKRIENRRGLFLF
jgi:GT2 family glycosyltransferase